jgi:hypothetical protein
MLRIASTLRRLPKVSYRLFCSSDKGPDSPQNIDINKIKREHLEKKTNEAEGANTPSDNVAGPDTPIQPQAQNPEPAQSQDQSSSNQSGDSKKSEPSEFELYDFSKNKLRYFVGATTLL